MNRGFRENNISVLLLFYVTRCDHQGWWKCRFCRSKNLPNSSALNCHFPESYSILCINQRCPRLNGRWGVRVLQYHLSCILGRCVFYLRVYSMFWICSLNPTPHWGSFAVFVSIFLFYLREMTPWAKNHQAVWYIPQSLDARVPVASSL